MEIRCGDFEKCELILFSIGFLACLLLMEKIFTIVLLVVYLLTLPRYIYSFRKLRLDESGVSITYWGYFQKHYSWDSFAEKQLVQPPPNVSIFELYRRSDRLYYRKPVLLSLKPIAYPMSITYDYIIWHPLSCVFIGFEDEFPKHKSKEVNELDREMRGFEIGRNEFISKMNEWGVEIKGLNDQK